GAAGRGPRPRPRAGGGGAPPRSSPGPSRCGREGRLFPPERLVPLTKEPGETLYPHPPIPWPSGHVCQHREYVGDIWTSRAAPVLTRLPTSLSVDRPTMGS